MPGAASGSTNPANAAPESATYYFSPRGSAGTTPWTATFNLNFTYTPTWLDGLSASVDVLNLFDTQTVLEYDNFSDLRFNVPNPDFGVAGESGVVAGQRFLTPRQVRLGVRYEF